MAACSAGPGLHGLHSPMLPKTAGAHQPGHCQQGEGEVEMPPLYLPPTCAAKIHLAALIFLRALHLFPQGLPNQALQELCCHSHVCTNQVLPRPRAVLASNDNIRLKNTTLPCPRASPPGKPCKNIQPAPPRPGRNSGHERGSAGTGGLRAAAAPMAGR